MPVIDEVMRQAVLSTTVERRHRTAR